MNEKNCEKKVTCSIFLNGIKKKIVRRSKLLEEVNSTETLSQKMIQLDQEENQKKWRKKVHPKKLVKK